MLSHLIELRRRLLRAGGVFLGFFLLFFFLSEPLFQLVVSPLLYALQPNSLLIATQITSPILTPIHLALNAALVATAPYVLIQFWQFIAPGLYISERKTIARLLVASLTLFFLGGIFCFYLVLPFIFHFFVNAVPKGVQFMPDMTYAIDFITRMLLLFGITFQVPLLCLLLVRFQLVTIDALVAARPYVIVAAFIIGMLLTPPDVLSQVLLAGPLCVLYELGIGLSRWQSHPLNPVDTCRMK